MLDVRTPFLDRLRWHEVVNLAESLPRQNRAMFQIYISFASTPNGTQSHTILSTQWNLLKDAVHECMAAEIGLETIDGLAHVS